MIVMNLIMGFNVSKDLNVFVLISRNVSFMILFFICGIITWAFDSIKG
jgi:hypothetical protein